MRALTLLVNILLATAFSAHAQNAPHHLLIHVDSADTETMVEALHNATNVIDTVRKQGGTVAIEIVANGPGTSMFIEELSPVKNEVRRVHAAYPDVVMSACGISLAHTEAAAKKKPHRDARGAGRAVRRSADHGAGRAALGVPETLRSCARSASST